MRINSERLLGDMRKLATFGKDGSGVHRLAFSKADMLAREWLSSRMSEGGLDPILDGVGNVHGKTRATTRSVLIGSHTDTVPHGGWLDGAMGVIYGLEVARCWREQGDLNLGGVDVISFQDEEGAYLSCLGSRSFFGEVKSEEIQTASNSEGEPLSEMIRLAGLSGRALARHDPEREIAYLEGHIEQGPQLESQGVRIGVVTGIVGIRRFTITIVGQADHAGTTPMSMRKDAVAVLMELGTRLFQDFRNLGSPETVWNLGNIVISPGAANVVPAKAELSVEFRDTTPEVLTRLEAAVTEAIGHLAASSPCVVESRPVLNLEPAAMDPALGRALHQAAEDHGLSHMAMPSGAGHDAMVCSRHLPSAMLFVPSIGGRSHDVAEHTADEDIVNGAQVLLTAVQALLGHEPNFLGHGK